MYKLAFVGNPNAGKSTWINYLANTHFKVANYLGVSVEAQTTYIQYHDKELAFVDLPGIYDLHVTSGEESYTKEYLNQNEVDLIVNVIDVRDLKRGLHLTSQLKSLGKPMLVLLNFVEKGMDYNKVKEISEIIKTPILFSEMKDKDKILDTFLDVEKHKKLESFNEKKIDRMNIDLNKKYYRGDAYLLHPIWGIPILILILILSIGGIYFLTLPISNFITFLCDLLVHYILTTIHTHPFTMHIIQALLFALSSILSFMPFLFGIFLVLAFLEESGYIARIAYLLDGVMHIFHLSGKSVIPLLVGFGCNVPAIMATRSIPSKKERVACALMIPFISCSAKLPIFLLFTSVFFKGVQIYIILLLYLLSIVTSLFIGAFFSMKQGKEELFILELPSYALPKIKTLWRKGSNEIKHFFKKASKVMLISMFLLTFIFPFIQKDAFQKVFIPLGFSQSEQAVESLPFGIISKENMIVYYAQKKGTQKVERYVQNLWKDPNQKLKALCYLLYLSMSIPCVMTLVAIKTEFGKKVLLLSLLIMLVVPYVISFIAYQGTLFLQSIF